MVQGLDRASSFWLVAPTSVTGPVLSWSWRKSCGDTRANFRTYSSGLTPLWEWAGFFRAKNKWKETEWVIIIWGKKKEKRKKWLLFLYKLQLYTAEPSYLMCYAKITFKVIQEDSLSNKKARDILYCFKGKGHWRRCLSFSAYTVNSSETIHVSSTEKIVFFSLQQ